MDKKIDFIGIGAGRAGTTWVSKLLEAHPDILFSSQKSYKELYFFNNSYSRKYEPDLVSHYNLGLKWYFKQFPKPRQNKIRGELCPAYLIDEVAHERIKKYFPNVKIIINLRNPIERLYSIYWYCKASVAVKMPQNFDVMVKDYKYLNRIKYYPHVLKFFEKFPSKNIHIIIFSDIKNSPLVVSRKLFKFLGVKSGFYYPFINEKINPAVETKFEPIKIFGNNLYRLLKKYDFKKPTNLIFHNKFLFNLYRKLNTRKFVKPPMKLETRKRLQEFFREDILKTQELINRDLGMWLK